MLCTFCGTENRPENKFCGMCGVRLERRKTERRFRQDSLKCPACGNANELGHKFCGMCGSRVDRRARERRAESPEQRATAMANAQLPTPEAPGRQSEVAPPQPASRTATEVEPSVASEIAPHPKTPPSLFRNEPPHVSSIGGPSFLGLGDDPQNNADYLLEDEGTSGGVLRKLVLIAVLAAIAGLVFVGWRTNWRANPRLWPQSKSQPTASSSPQSAGPEAAPDRAEAASPGSSSTADRQNDAKDASPQAEATASPATTNDGAQEKPVESTGDKPAPLPKASLHETPETERRPSATLLRAQQYLQGRGVKQNCEQGLMYLRAAAEKNEPAAAVQMGALYASGHCVQRDQVTAYRWFNSAHELDPANPWIQTNLDQLWAQMTPQERQRVAQ